ncbi:phage terminase large subunit family protein [Crenalkalicoccus roseus]|uniref:phage terminase large subunit family protein n=1 Tax=Crenalkalicoccus roseus TaxID=1485588 RepID=UPI0010816597|nr:phage terminase large subunit family protein [Crenalkalicoccus roseus]
MLDTLTRDLASGTLPDLPPLPPGLLDDLPDPSVRLANALRGGLRPDPDLTVSEWADRHRILNSRSSAEPGPYRTARTPYLREIMDALSPRSAAQRVVFMKGAQIGGSEAGNNWLGYIIACAPASVMAVQPTVELAKRFSKQRVDALIESTPALRERVAPARSRDSGNTVLQKDFPGGTLVLTGANSAVGLRSMPAQFLFLDEVDAYPGDVEGEGDPVALAEARARTFGARRKTFLVSTPTIAGLSRIEREYLATDQRRYFVPCPHCGHMQWLRWENLRWEKGAPETAAYHCEECGAAAREADKPAMFAAGEWRPTAESADPAARGYHVSALYSPIGWLSWAEIARQWEAAQGDDRAIKTFKNTVLGETWQEAGEAPDWQRLYDRREHWPAGTVPMGGLLLTAGVDVQRDRLECSVWAWGQDRQSWLVEHRVLAGNPFEGRVWEELRLLLGETWRHASGHRLPIAMAAIDSGDGMTTAEVYAFVRRVGGGRVIAVKGQDGLRAAIGSPSRVEIRRNGRDIRGLKVWPVGSSFLKAETYGWLKLDRPTEESGAPFPPGYVHLPVHAASEEFCRQLCAEQLVERAGRNGFRRLEWVKTRERNEALDCRVYARAAAAALRVDGWGEGRWARQAQAMEREPPSVAAIASRVSAAPPLAPARPERPARRVMRPSYLD